VEEYYQAVDLFCVRIDEGMPKAVIEAMASGFAVYCDSVQGTAENGVWQTLGQEFCFRRQS
jgi:hypothetical protein